VEQFRRADVPLVTLTRGAVGHRSAETGGADANYSCVTAPPGRAETTLVTAETFVMNRIRETRTRQ